MSKLFVFGIGGTGSRVIKSLTYLLASGIDINVSKIIPIIIDPDEANGDVNRTIALLKDYCSIRNDINNNSEKSFFNTEILEITQNFKLNIRNSNKKFKEYIDYASLDESNKALASMLFSDDNLESHMEVGFKGNPNIGSVVLNQFQQSDDFKIFSKEFVQGDKIFIISSIFGGTGAAGFPLLLKNIRSSDHNLTSSELFKTAPIGAITVLPYFNLKHKEESAIDNSTFISKTKAALAYYEHNITDNNLINTLYYIGDNSSKSYENNEGSFAQKNDAHFIELISALAIVDFANEDNYSMNIVKEFGIKNDTKSITFNDLSIETQRVLARPLSQYYYFNLFLRNHLSNSFEAPFAKSTPNIHSEFTKGKFYLNIQKFNNEFENWLQEMRNNERSFVPFELNPTSKEIYKYINNIVPKKDGFLSKKNYDHYTVILNKIQKEIYYTEINQKFVQLFYLATKELVREKFNF